MPLAQLPTIPADAPKPLQVYRHFKGQHAFVVGTFIHSETRELLVGYQEEGAGGDYSYFVRPLAMFTDTLPSGVKRFTYVSGA